METIQIFMQGEGIREIRLVEVPSNASVRDVVAVAAVHGFPAAADPAVAVIFIEDSDDALPFDLTIEAVGIHHHGSMHVQDRKSVV